MINPSRAQRTKSTFPDSKGTALGHNEFTPGVHAAFQMTASSCGSLSEHVPLLDGEQDRNNDPQPTDWRYEGQWSMCVGVQCYGTLDGWNVGDPGGFSV